MENQVIKSKITLAHIAMARGWVNGLDLGDMAIRYLPALGDYDGEIDLRIAKSSLSRVLEELSLSGKRMGHTDSSILLRQAKRIRSDCDGPTWEDFVETLDNGDNFSEVELAEIYKERFGVDKSFARQSRLIERQLHLLSQLSTTVGQPMALFNSVHDWFIQSLAERLEASGICDISTLCKVVLEAPNHWFIDAPGVVGIGQEKAARITAMLEAHLGNLSSVALNVGFHAQLARASMQVNAAPVTDYSPATLQPLPAMASLPVLPGIKVSALSATTDIDALKTWLSLKASSLTVALYQREVVRLISWVLREYNKSLSSVSVEDAVRYREFLCTTPEKSLIKKGPQRGFRSKERMEGTMPVAGFTQAGLSPASVKKALVIISGFFSWLVSVNHVQANPFASVKMAPSLPGSSERSTRFDDLEGLAKDQRLHESMTDRTLPTEAIQAIRTLTSHGTAMSEEACARASFVFEFAIQTGLRISELAAARLDHLSYIDATTNAGGWMLRVIGKRAKVREVPFPPLLIPQLKDYFECRGVIDANQPLEAASPGTFLIGALPSVTSPADRANGIRAQAIHTCLKKLFDLTVQNFEFANPKSSSQLQRSTTHWLRHTAATRAVAADVPLDVVASTLGHASMSTTSRYVRAGQSRKMVEMNRLWEAIPKAA